MKKLSKQIVIAAIAGLSLVILNPLSLMLSI